jgi:hypothetical protein
MVKNLKLYFFTTGQSNLSGFMRGKRPWKRFEMQGNHFNGDCLQTFFNCKKLLTSVYTKLISIDVRIFFFSWILE